MKQLLFLYLLIFSVNFSHAQTWQWAVGGGSSNNSAIADQFERIEDIALDVHGNVYTLSNVGTNDINVGGVPVVGWQYGNILVNSFTCDGALRWSKIIGPIGPHSDIALRTDSLDGVYFIISTNVVDSLHVDDDTTLWEPSQKHAWLFKYDTSGNLKWFADPEPVTLGAQEDAEQTSLDVDGDGNVYWLCHLHPGVYGGSGGYTVMSEGEYILRYNKNGAFQGATKLDMFFTSGGRQGIKLTRTQNSENFILSGTVYLKAYVGNDSITNSMVVVVFDKNGNFLWKKENTNHQITEFGFAGRPAIDELENMYFSGYSKSGDQFAGHTIINGGTNITPFVIKLDENGNKLWARDAVVKSKSKGQAIALRNSGEVDLLSYASYLQWPPSQDTSSTFNAGTVVTRFNTQTGKFLGFDTTSTSLPFPGGGAMVISEPTAAIANGRNGIFVGGSFMHSIIAGNNPAVNKTGGYDDFFVAKYGADSCNCGNIPEPKFTSINASGNTFNFTYTGSTPYNSIVWDFGDGNTSTQLNPTHSFAKDGNYAVTVTVTNDCGDNTYGNNEVALNVPFLQREHLTLYPNPSNGVVTISGIRPDKIAILNMQGQLMTTYINGSTTLDISSLSPGVYFLQCTTSVAVSMYKFIKE
jgi:PKD repeat protein